ncbi:transglutaminase-like domain-containing protein [Clostridium algoriphilum]|uniref:transglutaminase domain-containing protein n=1 Tax=Clostridium algoriphilum TaxID=198347 RepID=UPI001CF3EC04|nr:transglutaminase-like domain-containing protein [Clostridium algoriphilum]MCB2292362.1 transglutaminase-like domain-containing protein [Clostridium algoriphilum]
MLHNYKTNKVLLSLALTMSITASTIGNLVQAAQTGSISIVNKSIKSPVYTVTTITAFRARVAYAIGHREDSLNISYKGSETIPNYNAFLLEVVTTAAKTAGSDYEKNLLKGYHYDGASTPTLSNTHFSLTYGFDYTETAKQVAKVNTKVKEVLSQIITPSMTEGQRIKAINSYICKKVAYDISYNNKNNTAYEALLGSGKSMCMGYSLLAYRMLTDAGVESRIVLGIADGKHAWNMVKVAGSWYHLDTTWNDPLPDLSGRVYETYSLRSDVQMKPSHVWMNSLYPIAAKSYIKSTDVVIPKSPVVQSHSVVARYMSVEKGKLYVKGLAKGDIITVYPSNPAALKGAKPISIVTVKKGYSSLWATAKTNTKYLYVTKTSVNKLQSNAISIRNR